MRGKILWLAFWMTLAYWLGGAVGCAGKGEDQNYKILEEDRPLLDTERPSRAPMIEALLSFALAADDMAPMDEPGIEDRTGSVIVEKSDSVMGPTMAGEMGPSLVGIDRSGWTPVMVSPASGVTVHGPVYFHDVPMCRATAANRADETGEPIVSAYAEGERDEVWSAQNGLALVVQPLKFGFDVLALPVKMILKPPFVTHETTP